MRNLLLLLIVAGCADEPSLTRDRACQDQAYQWCEAVRGGSGCWYAYAGACAGQDATARIPESSQGECLDAMTEVAPSLEPCHPLAGDCVVGVPSVCRALWATSG